MNERERIWTSRKFISAWFLTWILVALIWWAKIDGSAFSTSLSFIWVGYFAGNVGERYVIESHK